MERNEERENNQQEEIGPEKLLLIRERELIDSDDYSLKKLAIVSLKEGLTNAITTGDYPLLQLITKFCLGYEGNVELIAASAFFTVFFALSVHAFSVGMTDAHGIFSARGLAEKNYKRSNLILRQSLLMCGIFFILFALLPSFYFRIPLQYIFKTSENLTNKSMRMIYWGLPGMFLRLLNDQLKVYTQNLGKSKELGRKFTLLFFVSVSPISYLIINIIKLEESSIGIVLFIYESLGLLLNLHYYYKEENRDTSIPILTNFYEFFKFVVPVYFIYLPNYLLAEFKTFIISIIGIEEQLAAFTIYIMIKQTGINLLQGFIITPRIEINKVIGEKMKVLSYEIYKKFAFINFITCFLLNAFFALTITIFLFFNLFNDRNLSKEIKRCLFCGILRSFFSQLGIYYRVICCSINKKKLLFYFDTIPYFGLIGQVYLVGYTFNLGLLGIHYAEAFGKLLRPWMVRVYLSKDYWEEAINEIF